MIVQHPTPRFHVIIVLGPGGEWAQTTLSALRAQTLKPGQITVFDNEVHSGTAERIERAFPEARVMRSPANLGLGGGCNRAAASVRDCDYILLLDPAAVPAMRTLERLAEIFVAYPKIGVLGNRVLDRDVETIRSVGVGLSDNAFPMELGKGEPDSGQFVGIREAPGVQGASMAARYDLWRALGGLDERYHPGGFECLDFCQRARNAGWQVAVDCETVVTHFEPWVLRRSDPAELENFFRNRARFIKKHYGAGDWLRRYLPAELRWLRDGGSVGMRGVALRAMLHSVLGLDKKK